MSKWPKTYRYQAGNSKPAWLTCSKSVGAPISVFDSLFLAVDPVLRLNRGNDGNDTDGSTLRRRVGFGDSSHLGGAGFEASGASFWSVPPARRVLRGGFCGATRRGWLPSGLVREGLGRAAVEVTSPDPSTVTNSQLEALSMSFSRSSHEVKKKAGTR